MTRSTTIPKAESPAPAAPVAPRLRLGKLCVAIQGSSPQELLDRAVAALADALPEAKFLEFRLDSVAKPALALPKL